MTTEIARPEPRKLTPEDIARTYTSAMDSVNVIMDGKPSDFTEAQWQDRLARNKEHLEIMLKQDFWTNEDLTPFKNALKF